MLAPPDTPEALLSPAFRGAAERNDVRIVEPPDARFRRDLLVLLADERTELVCSVGGTAAVASVAAEFPTARFCVIGGASRPGLPSNVAQIPWPIEEGARLAGVGAAVVAPSIAVVGPRSDDVVAGVSAGARSIREDASVTVAGSLSPAVAGRVVVPVGDREAVRTTVEAVRAGGRIVVGWMVDPRTIIGGDLPLAVSVVADVDHLVRTLAQGDPEARFSVVPGTGPRAGDIARRVTASRG